MDIHDGYRLNDKLGWYDAAKNSQAQTRAQNELQRQGIIVKDFARSDVMDRTRNMASLGFLACSWWKGDSRDEVEQKRKSLLVVGDGTIARRRAEGDAKQVRS